MLRNVFIAMSFIISSFAQAQIEWKLFPEQPGDTDLNAISIGPDGTWYCMGNATLFSSLDSGATWTFETKIDISIFADIRRLKFLEDGTPLYGKQNSPKLLIKRDSVWVETTFSDDFETFKDTIYGIKQSHVQKSYDKGLTWSEHLKVPGMNIYRYRQHNGRHYVEYSVDVNRRFGEITLDGTILRKSFANHTTFEKFVIDDCDNIHYLSRFEQTVLFPDGTKESAEWGFVDYKYQNFKTRVYRMHTGYLYGNLDCGNEWESLGHFPNAKEFFPIGLDTMMIVYEKFVRTYKLPDTLISEQAIKNVPFTTWNVEELPNGARFAFTNDGHFKITSDGVYEPISWSLHRANFGPTGWIYQHPFNTPKIPVSKDAGITWDSILMPAGADPFSTYPYPITEDIISFSGFDGTFISLPDGSLHHLPSDTVNDLVHFYTTYQKVGNLILMRENLTANISGFDLTTREFLPLLYHNTTGSSWSNIDAEGTLYNVELNNTVLTVSEYPYTQFKSVTLPNEIFKWATVVDKGIVMVYGYNAYHFDKALTVSELPLGPMEGESFNRLFKAKSGRWIMTTGSRIHPAYHSTTQFPESHLGSMIKGNLISTDVVCDSIALMSGTNWKFQFKNDEYEIIALGKPDGLYGFNLPNGTYDVRTIPPYYELWEACEWPTEITMDGSPVPDFNFLTQFKEDCHAGEISLSAPFYRRCFETTAYVNIRNAGAVNIENANARLILPQELTFVSSPWAFTMDNEEFVFPLSSIHPGELIRIPVTLYVPCENELGEIACAGVALEVFSECAVLTYADQLCMDVIGSWDPNDKHATNQNGSDRAAFQQDEFIYYKVNFQNTGTDTAFTVRIVDDLDESLDLLTFEMVSSSHDLNFHFEERKLVVEFENIKLPDSTRNLIGSNGFFEFRIKMDSAFTANDTIFNQAGIVFDFNEPIITNTVATRLDTETSVKVNTNSGPSFLIKPNPASNNISIEYSNQNANPIGVTIFDVHGKVVHSNAKWISGEALNIQHLQDGMYFIRLMHEHQQSVQKFVKQ